MSRTRAAFAPKEVVLLDDCGPPISSRFFPAAFQDRWLTSWDALPNLPTGCPNCDPRVDGGGIHALIPYYASTPSFRGALVVSRKDEVVGRYLALPPYGNPALHCPLDGGACEFPAAIDDLVVNVMRTSGPGKFHIFEVDGYQHCWESNSPGAVRTDGGVLSVFESQELADDPAWADLRP